MMIHFRPLAAAALLTIGVGASAHFMPAPVTSIDADTNIITWAPVPGAVNYEVTIDGVTTTKIAEGEPLMFDASALPANTSVAVRAIGERNAPPRSEPGAVLVVDQGTAPDPEVSISLATGDGVYTDVERTDGITISGTTTGLTSARQVAINANGRGYVAVSDPAVNNGDWSVAIPGADVNLWPDSVDISAYVQTAAGVEALASSTVVYRATQAGGTAGTTADGWVAGAVHPADTLPVIVADADFDGGQAIEFNTSGGVLERYDYEPAGGFGTGDQWGFDVKMPSASDTYLFYINVTNAAGDPFELNITNRSEGARFVTGDEVFFIDPARTAGVRKREVVNLASMMANRGGLGTIESVYLRAASGARMDRIGRTSGETLSPSFAPPAFPSAPGSLRYTALGETSVTLAWNAASDADGSVERYLLWQDGVDIADTAGLSIEVTGLTADVTYAFEVSAVDDAGNEGDRSTVLNVTPSASPPASTDGMANLTSWGTTDAGPAAFPGAMGMGRSTRGGRTAGVQHIVVDTTASGKNASDGLTSLREALETNGPKIISFAVGGVFRPGTDTNPARVFYPTSDTTLLCVTAPNPGVIIRADNYVLSRKSQYIERGCIHAADDESKLGDFQRGFTASYGGSNIILDHGEYYWGGDENLLFYNSTAGTSHVSNVTLQFSVVAEGDVDSSHAQSKSRAAWAYHAQGPNCNSNDTRNQYSVYCTLAYNLIAHSTGRNPACMGAYCEIEGNITYNGRDDSIQYHTNSGHYQGDVDLRYVNNLIKKGPNYSTLTNISNARDAVVSGNYVVQIGQPISSATSLGGERNDPLDVVVDGVDNLGDIKTLAQDPDYLACLGAVPHRSNTAARIVTEFEATGSFGSGGWNQSASSTAGGTIGVAGNTVPSGWWTFSGTARADLGTHDVTDQRGPEYTANGWNSNTTLSGDTDGDTMPDAWETANGLNPNDASDALGNVDGDAWLNIEEYAAYLSRCAGAF